jgi:hypothetical protein
MTRNKKLGIIYLISPIILLFIILLIFALSSFFLTSINSGATDKIPEAGTSTVIAAPFWVTVVRLILAIAGIVAVFGVFVGVPVGLYYLLKKEDKTVIAKFKEKSAYKNIMDEQVAFIHNWSWGAFWGTMVWALGNKLYLWSLPFIATFLLGGINVYVTFNQTLSSMQAKSIAQFTSLLAIPLGIINIIVWIYLSVKGRQLAWEKGWLSFAEFANRQRVMARIIVLWIIFLTGVLLWLNLAQHKLVLN